MEGFFMYSTYKYTLSEVLKLKKQTEIFALML